MIHLLGRSKAHEDLVRLVQSAAGTDAEVLIHGPTGVGKELYARLLHESSPRSGRAFVPVNCGALSAELFENELFGHVGGAFTGARARAAGLVAEAEGGTLFLDEIDALQVANQVKLLRLIQQKEYRPLGESRLRTCDVRFVAATNADLTAEVSAGRFRQDLFFRLRVLPLQVLPLRERSDDIALLLEHFVLRYAGEYGKQPVRFTARALARLQNYPWPGNVREVENCARFLLCTRPGEVVDAGELPLLLDQEPPPAPAPAPHAREPFGAAKRRLVRDFEKAYVEEKLLEHCGNIAAAARASGKHRRAFFELMRRHGIRRPR